MVLTLSDVKSFFEENDVKFVRLAFCDLNGREKNMSVMASAIDSVATDGVTVDGSALAGFEDIKTSDLIIKPDLSTMCVLPWRPQQGRVVRFFCDVMYPDKRAYVCDARQILLKTVKNYEKIGIKVNVGLEGEFYLTKTDESGLPLLEPIDNGGYLDIAPIDKGVNLRRECCLCLEDMGIKPHNSHHEQGRGQNEIDFMYGDPLTAADNFVTFKTVIKSIAARNGVYASFMPKPFPNESGSGLHVNLSLERDGQNLFSSTGELHPVAANFIGGILSRIREFTAFANATVNSYARLGKMEAPKLISWSKGNRSQLIRIPAAAKGGARMELRSPDGAANTYLLIALILAAGLEGINNRAPLADALNVNTYTAEEAEKSALKSLPDTLEEALALAEDSEFVKGVLGEDVTKKYVALKRKECEACAAGNAEAAERQMYFNVL